MRTFVSERGGHRRLRWEAFGPNIHLIPLSPIDHSNLGGGAACVCPKRRGPQPGLETLAGGREVASGKLGEGWEGRHKWVCLGEGPPPRPFPNPRKSTSLPPPWKWPRRKTKTLRRVERPRWALAMH
jgi:hypothetical protein